jgi:mRNA-degrading endonuclease toxin of MazEF toxin-antitoxin module
MSACRLTIAAFLPPISAMHGRGQRPCAIVRQRCMPTSYDPVNVTPATSGCRISASPSELPGPVT